MRSKKSVIWISAVLYIAMGIIVISILLTAVIPVVNKLKDKNTFIDTKKLLYILDNNIKTVAKEGPGSQRDLSPFVLNAGKLFIFENNETIVWTMETTAELIEPNIPINEGVLDLYLEKTQVVGKNLIKASIDYGSSYDLKLSSSLKPPFSGRYSLLIKHTGNYTMNKPVIEISIN